MCVDPLSEVTPIECRSSNKSLCKQHNLLSGFCKETSGDVIEIHESFQKSKAQ